MELHITLILTSLFFSTALALRCYQCIPGPSETCESPETMHCPDQCGSMTASINISGTFVILSAKSCLSAAQCNNGSVHVPNQLTASMNMKCCNTDLCNNQTLPALIDQTSNGHKCYTRSGENCSVDCQGEQCINTIETVDCVGNEDHCINITTVGIFGFASSMEGCATKSVCDLAAMMGFGSSVQCCEGNLCNGAERFTLSFLPLIVPLIPFILFY